MVFDKMRKSEKLIVLKIKRKKLIRKMYNTLEHEVKIANEITEITNELHMLKREVKIANELGTLEGEAEIANELPDYHNNQHNYNIDIFYFNLILNNSYGRLVYKNQPIVDNCYDHKLVSIKGTIFRTLTEKKVYSDF